MTVPVAEFIAGPFTAYWVPKAYTPSTSSTLKFQGGTITNLMPLGIVERGFELDPVFYSEAIRGDNLGRATQNGVLQGDDVYLNFTLQQFNIGAAASVFWPTKASDPTTTTPTHMQTNLGYQGQVGRLSTDVGGAIYLYAASGTTAYRSDSMFKVFRALKCSFPDNYNPKWLMATRLRNVPIRLQLLPYLDGNSLTTNFEVSDSDA